jgi:flagellar biosynthesis protein FlhF
MEVKTFRARTMQQALELVRRELGPQAAVLHTREVSRTPMLSWVPGMRQIEVTASLDVHVPSRLPARRVTAAADQPALVASLAEQLSARAESIGERSQPGRHAHEAAASPQQVAMANQLTQLQGMVEDLCHRSRQSQHQDLPDELFRLFAKLIDAELSEELARELVERVREIAGPEDVSDPALLRACVVSLVEDEITTSGPIRCMPGQPRLVALVGPTGVGKTTTIAKLAANYRLRDKQRVGLITVDTYRIAAVEQLRTYADIIDLPMRVVSSPKEMRDAVAEMGDLDLVLLDTAGRSPRDDVKIQELRNFVAESRADEVHLVLSAVSSTRALVRTAQRFAAVGTTSLILTKLDEATGLGCLLPLLRCCKLPLSYVTDGQNVPDDIDVASARRMAEQMLSVETDH